MGRIIQAGVIGCGGISATHLRALMGIEGVRVAAFCDTARDRAERRAAEYGGGDVYEDYRDVLARDDIDAVHVLTPHHLHGEMCLAALARGKYTLCEKPMAIRLDEARAMRAADTDHRLGVIFQNRYNASATAAKKLLDSGEMGKIIAARATVAWLRDAAYYAGADWRGKWATEGGGSLINQSIHTVDLLYYLCGPFARVKGKISTDLLQGVIEVEDNCHAVIQFTGGFVGLLHTSNNFGFSDMPEILIYCENGLLTLHGETLTLTRDGAVTVLSDARARDNGAKAVYGNSHAIQIAEFYKSIRNKAPIWIDGNEGYPAIWAVLGVYESSRTDQWVEFE